MASVAGTLGGFGQASYAATKASVIGLGKSMALEGARFGITANIIAPGIIGTEAWQMGDAKMNDRMVLRTAMRSAGEPEDIANAIVFLARRRRATSPVRCSPLREASTSSSTDTSDPTTTRQPVDVGVTYWSREVGPYVWHEYDAARTRCEPACHRQTRHPHRAHAPPWDAFMPHAVARRAGAPAQLRALRSGSRRELRCR